VARTDAVTCMIGCIMFANLRLVPMATPSGTVQAVAIMSAAPTRSSIRPVDRRAYQGRAVNESEILGPEITAGACKEMRTPAYTKAARERMTTPSPTVSAGLRVSVGLKRNDRIGPIVPASTPPVTFKPEETNGISCELTIIDHADAVEMSEPDSINTRTKRTADMSHFNPVTGGCQKRSVFLRPQLPPRNSDGKCIIQSQRNTKTVGR